MHSLFINTWMWVSVINYILRISCKKKTHFCQRIHPDQIQRRIKHRWSGSSASTPSQSCISSWVYISFSNIRKFWCICCLMLMVVLFHKCICLDMLSLVSASSSPVFWSRDSVLFQKFIPHHTTEKTQKAGNFRQLQWTLCQVL